MNFFCFPQYVCSVRIGRGKFLYNFDLSLTVHASVVTYAVDSTFVKLGTNHVTAVPEEFCGSYVTASDFVCLFRYLPVIKM